MTQATAGIAQLPLPATLDAADPAAADFIAAVELINANYEQIWGNGDFRDTPQTQLAGYRPTPLRRRILLGARTGSGLAGVAMVTLPLTDNLHSARVHVAVAPAARRTGLGTRLYAAAEQAAVGNGRRTLLGETDHPGRPGAGAGSTLAPKSGTGSVPSDAAAQFAVRSGFTLEQVDRVSLLNVADINDGPEVSAAAAAAAGDGYALEFWHGACPEPLVSAYALLRQKMSTDAPMAGLDLEEEQWDAARIRETERKAQEMDAQVLVSAVRDVSSGQLAGHTVLMVFNSNPAVAFQDDTLVLHGHRGHRLGMLLKAANLVRLQEELPAAARIWTWNAAENSYMLTINEKLGFEAVGYSGQWQKSL